LATILSERDLLDRGAGADIGHRVDALKRGRGAQRIREAARQLRSIAGIAGSRADEMSIGTLVALAWPDRIAQARGARGRFRLSGGGGAMLPDHDPLAGEKWLAVAVTDGASGDQRILLAAPLTIGEIERHFASHITTQDIIAWDDRAEAVTMSRRRMFMSLVLSEMPLTHADPDRVGDAMIEGLAMMGLNVLPWIEETRNLVARVRFTKRLFPDMPWPDLEEASLTASMMSWLKPYLAGMSRKSHLARLDMTAIMRSLIPHDLLHRLDRLAPTHVPIPSGARIAIDYLGEGDPILRARLQEMFGLTDSPTIAEGRAKLRIELLSPARRPLAVTQDLQSFWANAYPQVRAEMRGRYPKHQWPENPFAAPPVRPGKVR
jgi:ATP-dependent helicase HrpB